MRRSPRIFISTGELSGDFHASHLVRAIRQKCPGAVFMGTGSHNMRDAGVEILHDSSTWGNIGIWNNSKNFFRLIKKRLEIAKQLEELKPDLLIVIDFRVFHASLLRLVQKLDFPKLYYVAPVIWPGFYQKGLGKKYTDFLARSKNKNTKSRFEALAEFADKLIVAYPFGVKDYQNAGADVVFLGHPLMNDVKTTKTKEQVFNELGLDSTTKLIGIFPGSRNHELKAHLPVLKEVISQLRNKIDRVSFYIPLAHPDHKSIICKLLGDQSNDIHFINGDDYNIFNASDLAISKTGTSVQILMALGVPMVAFYTVVSSLWYNLSVRYLVHFDHIAFPNVLAGKRVVPEFIQDDFKADKIVESALGILNDDAKRNEMKRNLLSLRDELYRPDALERAAEIALEMIDKYQHKK
jgi:lipid-A-disaccharide synthase